jgi:hypothetical protein
LITVWDGNILTTDTIDGIKEDEDLTGKYLAVTSLTDALSRKTGGTRFEI